jgi:hypothetical protein
MFDTHVHTKKLSFRCGQIDMCALVLSCTQYSETEFKLQLVIVYKILLAQEAKLWSKIEKYIK